MKAMILWVGLTGLFVACGREEPKTPPESPPTVVAASDSMTVNSILRTDPRFSTLIAGLDSTRLDSILSSPGPYTVFVPPDSAFGILPDGTVSVLLTDRVDRLRTILAHHVVDGRLDLASLPDSGAIPTLGGDSLQVRRHDSTHAVGNADVIDGDISGANGLIHVVNRVLRPPE